MCEKPKIRHYPYTFPALISYSIEPGSILYPKYLQNVKFPPVVHVRKCHIFLVKMSIFDVSPTGRAWLIHNLLSCLMPKQQNNNN